MVRYSTGGCGSASKISGQATIDKRKDFVSRAEQVQEQLQALRKGSSASTARGISPEGRKKEGGRLLESQNLKFPQLPGCF